MMNNKTTKKNTRNFIKLASSPCAIDDVDPKYMGLADLDKKKRPKKIKKSGVKKGN